MRHKNSSAVRNPQKQINLEGDKIIRIAAVQMRRKQPEVTALGPQIPRRKLACVPSNVFYAHLADNSKIPPHGGMWRIPTK